MRKRKQNWFYGISTHTGSVRQSNEDNVYINTIRDRKGNEMLVTVVADGMGGYDAGDVASETIVTMIDKWFRKKVPPMLALPYPFTKIANEIDKLLQKANATLISEGEKLGNKMGTTASILFLYKNQYFITHIGDSRIYQISENPEQEQEDNYQLVQLTEDHSWVMDQVKKNLLTEEEAEKHPKKNLLLQCLGITEDFSPFMTEGSFSKQDTFFLCSDGFYNIYPKQALLEGFRALQGSDQTFQSFADCLVKDADQRGATDNITVSIVTPKY